MSAWPEPVRKVFLGAFVVEPVEVQNPKGEAPVLRRAKAWEARLDSIRAVATESHPPPLGRPWWEGAVGLRNVVLLAKPYAAPDPDDPSTYFCVEIYGMDDDDMFRAANACLLFAPRPDWMPAHGGPLARHGG